MTYEISNEVTQATITEASGHGEAYRLIQWHEEMPLFELYQAQLSYEELGDAESGPTGIASYVEAWDLITEGIGDPDIIEAIAQWKGQSL